MGYGRPWTIDEEDYLMEHWGRKSVPNMAQNLGRSENAIVVRAKKLGLGAFLKSGDMITFYELVNAFGRSESSYFWMREKWARHDFPFHRKKVINNSFLMVNIDEFWGWAEKHQDILDFSDFEEYSLGEEPVWVKQKRSMDCRKKRRNSRPWTKEDDGKLRSMLRLHHFSMDEIANSLGRKEGAICRRMKALGLKERPVRGKDRVWTDEESQTLWKLRAAGKSWEDIAAVVGRSSAACRKRYERISKEGCMRKEIRNDSAAFLECFQRHQCAHYTAANGCDISGTDCDSCVEFRRRNPAEDYAFGLIDRNSGTNGDARIRGGKA